MDEASAESRDGTEFVDLVKWHSSVARVRRPPFCLFAFFRALVAGKRIYPAASQAGNFVFSLIISTSCQWATSFLSFVSRSDVLSLSISLVIRS